MKKLIILFLLVLLASLVCASELKLSLKCADEEGTHCIVGQDDDVSVKITVTNNSTTDSQVRFDIDLEGEEVSFDQIVDLAPGESDTITVTVLSTTISAAGGGGTLKVTATMGEQKETAYATISTVRTVSFPEIPLSYSPVFALLIALIVLMIIKFKKCIPKK